MKPIFKNIYEYLVQISRKINRMDVLLSDIPNFDEIIESVAGLSSKTDKLKLSLQEFKLKTEINHN